MKKYEPVLRLAARWGWDLLWSIFLVSVGIAYLAAALGIESRFWTPVLSSNYIVILALVVIVLRRFSEWILSGLLQRSPKKSAEVLDASRP